MKQEYRDYLFTYNHEDSRWSFKVSARSPEDAQERISKLQFAQYEGVVALELPVSTGLFAPVIAWWRNLWGEPERAR